MAHYVTPSSEAALVLRNSAETLTVTFYSAETPTAPNTGSLTVGIVDDVQLDGSIFLRSPRSG